MKSIQYRYPFSNNVFTLNNVITLQIGIQRPWSIPLIEDIPFTIPILINKHEYSITDKNILEFNEFNRSIEIEIREKLNPYLIVDIIYKTAD